MIREFFNVLRHYEVHSLRGSFHVTDFKNLHIVSKDIRRHLERWNVNHIHIWVFRCKDPTDLCVFPLQKFVHRNSFHLLNRKRVDMNFDTSSLLDCRPLLPELFHHLLPYEQRFTGELINSLFRLFLENIQAEATLNDGSLTHQEL